MPENHEEDLNVVQQIEVALASVGVRMPWGQAMTSHRRQVILSVILDQLETAGPAGFAAIHYFGMIEIGRRGPAPLAIRRAKSVYNILEAIARSHNSGWVETARVELEEFRAGLDELTLDRIKDAGDVWYDRMKRFWASESARMRAELAAEQ